jgi:hypothetical protein
MPHRVRAAAVAVALVCACASTPPVTGDAPVLGPPWVTLAPGARYLTVGGKTQPLLVRNVSAPDVAQFQTFLDAAASAGVRLVRIHLTQGMGSRMGIDAQGAVDAAWAGNWDRVIDAAAARGISVVPVFAIWGDWNDGTPALGWVNWPSNPLGQAMGGPAASPADLFADTAAQRAWLTWMQALVGRWQARANIAAWEVFSEMDIATGTDEASATAFAGLAADRIRAADTYGRPVMASTSDLVEWQQLWASRADDLVQLHPYGDDLDQLVLERVATRLAAAGKPVLIGESGVSAAAPDGTTITSAPGADRVLRHAIWAGLVSGAADARAFWWEDSYAVYYPGTGLPLVDRFATLEAPVPAFLGATDFTGLEPAAVQPGPSLAGAALARQDLVVGWFRDVACADTASSCDATIDGASVVVTLPGAPAPADGAWSATTTDPATGHTGFATATAAGGSLTVTLPAFSDAIAFQATPLAR